MVHFNEGAPVVPVVHRAGVADRLLETTARALQRQALATICFGIFSALSIWFSASAVLGSMAAAWHISESEGSFLTSMVNGGFCIGCLVSAATSLPDRVPCHILILLGSEGAAAANMGLLLVEGFGSAMLCRFVVGFCLSLVYPPGVKLLSTWFDAKERSRAIGILFGFFCLGSAFPQLLSAALAHAVLDWRTVVIVTSSAAAASGFLIGGLVRVGPFPFQKSSGRLSLVQSGVALRDARVRLAILAYCGHMWELFCVWAWLAQFLRSSWRMRPTTAPLMAFAVIAMGFPGSWIGGILGERFGCRRIAMAFLAVSGICIAAIGALANEGPLVIRIILFLIWGAAAIGDSPQFSAIITLHVDQRYVGTAMTIQMLCGYLVTVLAMWVVPRIASDISWRWSFFSLAAGPVVSLAALACMHRGDADSIEKEPSQPEPLQQDVADSGESDPAQPEPLHQASGAVSPRQLSQRRTALGAPASLAWLCAVVSAPDRVGSAAPTVFGQSASLGPPRC